MHTTDKTISISFKNYNSNNKTSNSKNHEIFNTTILRKNYLSSNRNRATSLFYSNHTIMLKKKAFNCSKSLIGDLRIENKDLNLNDQICSQKFTTVALLNGALYFFKEKVRNYISCIGLYIS